MEEMKSYTTAQSFKELFDSSEFHASTYDHSNRAKRFSNMQIRAEYVVDLYENLHFTTNKNGEFSIASEFLGETIGVFIGKLNSNRKDMTFTLKGAKAVGSAKTIETV